MAIKRIKFIFIPALCTVILFVLLEKNFLPGSSRKSVSDDQFRLVGSVAYLIRDEYVEEPNPSKTMDGAFRGLVDSLDILSSYLDSSTVLKYKYRKDNDLQDPGLVLFKRFGSFPIVIGIGENSPAERAGLKLGESISTLNGRSTLSMSMVEMNLLLKDKSSEPVQLKILRGTGAEVVRVERAKIPAEVYSYSSLEGTSGILKVRRFYPPCVQMLKDKVVPKLKTENKPLVMDLRDCAEGDIEEAQNFLNIFMGDQGTGYFECGKGIKETLALQEEPELKQLPLFVWTNQATIGPAEAVAALLKADKKAKVIGLQTPGLVSKQDFIFLNDGSGLLLTSAIFHLKEDKDFWEKGIEPDIKIDVENMNSGAYLKATQKLLSN